MTLSESDTRAKLIDPAIHARGWTEELIRREETAGAIEIVDGKPRKQAKGRVDYTMAAVEEFKDRGVAFAYSRGRAIEERPGWWTKTSG